MEQVTVSKIFPAGAGWQAASIVADAAGHQADSLAFAAYTGVGDGIAVAAGHTGYYAAKKAIVDPNINIGEQAGLGVWLGSAAVCSGALWQPLVNALQASEKLPFNAVMGATMVGCGGAFLTLRLPGPPGPLTAALALYSNTAAVTGLQHVRAGESHPLALLAEGARGAPPAAFCLK